MADETPARFVEAVLPSMFSGTVPQHVADGFGASIAGFHPAGLRSMAEGSLKPTSRTASRASIPTLLLYGGEDVRAPRAVREAIHDAIPGSRLVVLDGVGHVGTLEAPERMDEEDPVLLDRVPI